MSFLHDANPGYIAASYDLTDPGDRDQFLDDHNLRGEDLFAEILRQLDDLGVGSVIAEYRYIDPDYRNEHARFYSSTFRRYPSIAVRLHFLAESIDDLDAVVDDPAVLAGMTYLGYVVLRPVPAAPIGRAMLASPSWAAKQLTCAVEERVSLFGSRLTVRGVPFMSQDGQLGVCAHASAWITAQQHHLRDGRPRRLPGDIADAVPGGPGLGRTSPASSVSVHQLSDAYSRLGLPPIVNWKEKLPGGEDIDALLCRYLNSALPVTVTSKNHHTFVLVGYAHVPSSGPTLDHWQQQADAAAARWSAAGLDKTAGRADKAALPAAGAAAGDGATPSTTAAVPGEQAVLDDAAGGEAEAAAEGPETESESSEAQPKPAPSAGQSVVFFLCQDDQAGPYQVRRLDNATAGDVPTAPWEFYLVPLPEKVYLSAEDAEAFANEWAMNELTPFKDKPATEAAKLRKRILMHETFWRTTLTTSNDFKAQLPARTAPAAITSHYRRTRMARLVYVCELVDRDQRRADLPSVIGEVVVDATSHQRKVDALAWRLPGVLGLWEPDSDEVLRLTGPAKTPLWDLLTAQAEVSGSSP